MFSDPISMEDWMTVLPWILTYLQKEDLLTGFNNLTKEYKVHVIVVLDTV